jgi:hypothetical protein
MASLDFTPLWIHYTKTHSNLYPFRKGVIMTVLHIVQQSSGYPNLKADNEESKRKAQEWAENLRPILEGLIYKGLTQRGIIEELIKAGVPTRRGGKWSLVQLQNTMKRLGLKTQRAKA